MFRRIDSEPDWILEHPDLEDESYGANHQTEFARGSPEFKVMYQHVEEAEDQVRMLDRAIRHLQRVSGTKSAVAQAQIDEYIAKAERYRQILQSILDTR